MDPFSKLSELHRACNEWMNVCIRPSLYSKLCKLSDTTKSDYRYKYIPKCKESYLPGEGCLISDWIVIIADCPKRPKATYYIKQIALRGILIDTISFISSISHRAFNEWKRMNEVIYIVQPNKVFWFIMTKTVNTFNVKYI